MPSAATKKRKLTSSSVAFPQVRHNTRETSSVGLTREIRKEFEFDSDLESPTYALPGGSNASLQASMHVEEYLTVKDLIGVDLPDKETADFLLESYFTSVQWFMMVIHEPTFKTNHEQMVTSGKAHRAQLGQVALTLLVLAMGARYATKADIASSGLQVDLDVLQSTFLAKVQDSLLTIINEAELESVQICILLSSFYLYHGKPNLGFVILGTGVRCAQAMNLQRESTWRKSTPVAREQRKRVWWALYVFDRFASIIFGRPCCIQDSESEVSMVQNMEDTTLRHPVFNSTETLEDGTMDCVTIFSYQRHKFRLYQIASPIVGDLYFHHGSSRLETYEKVKSIHEDLISWFAALPPELKLSGQPELLHHSKSSIETTFKLQALALQLAYDNIQILLHRPLLSYNNQNSRPASKPQGPSHVSVSSPLQDEFASGLTTPMGSQEHFSISKTQCWESAIRTSQLVNHKGCLIAATHTHAASYIGIHLFTAGMILSIVALSKPLSARAQEAKKAISHILHMLKWLEDRILLSKQSGSILEDLVRQIFAKEMGAIVSHSTSETKKLFRPNTRTMHQSGLKARNSTVAENELLKDFPSGQNHGQPCDIIHPASHSTSMIESDNSIQSSGYTFDESVFSIDPPLENTDYQQGITNVQQFMFDQFGAVLTQYTGHGHEQIDTDHTALQPGTYLGGNINGAFPGQAWLWDPYYE